MKTDDIKEALKEAIRLEWESRETSGRVIIRNDLSVLYGRVSYWDGG